MPEHQTESTTKKVREAVLLRDEKSKNKQECE